MARLKNTIYMVILVLFCCIYLLMPLTDPYPLLRPLLTSILTLNLMFSVWFNRLSMLHAVLGILFGIAAMVAGFMLNITANTGYHAIALSITILFYAHAAGLMLWRIFSEKKVTNDLIFGAVCVYALFAIIFGLTYALLDIYSDMPVLSGHNGDITTRDYVYFSIVTLTTLGYGDLVPAIPMAKSLVAFEAMLGQLYLTILVAHLVGLHLQQK